MTIAYYCREEIGGLRWPISEADIRRENRHTAAFPATLLPEHVEFLGYRPVYAEPAPYLPDYANHADTEPALIGGQYRQQHQFTDWSLDEAKAAHWSKVKARRDSLETDGFIYGGHLMDSDERAVQRISMAVQAAQAAMAAGQPFAITWTCKDGYLMPLDGPGMIGLPVALATRANALHVYAKTLKDAIFAADSVDAVRAIDIFSNWPEV